MLFYFRLITGNPGVRIEADIEIPASDLLDASKKLKDYLSECSSLVVVGYDYLVQFDDGTLLSRTMSDDFYEKYILEDDSDV